MAKRNESKLQQGCVKWFRLQYPQYLIFAIPNGGFRSKIEASIMQGEGVLAGVPDLQIIMHDYSFFVEMKAEKGKLTDNQKLIHGLLSILGFKVHVCRSLDEFMEIVNSEIKNRLVA